MDSGPKSSSKRKTKYGTSIFNKNQEYYQSDFPGLRHQPSNRPKFMSQVNRDTSSYLRPSLNTMGVAVGTDSRM